MRSTFKVLFYLKRNSQKQQKVVPVMGRITINGTIAQFSAKISVPVNLWEVKGGHAKGKSLEADRINRHLDNIRGQINKHYQSICDHETHVTAEKVRNEYLGFSKKYKTLLEAFKGFNDALKERIGVDRSKSTWERYRVTTNHLSHFMKYKYHVSDKPLAELEVSFIELFHVYLKTERSLKPLSISRYLDCLVNVVNISFNDGLIPRNPFATYRYAAPTPERTFLTEEELRKFQKTSLCKSRHEFVRDMFLFSCFTGICHADMRALTWSQVIDETNSWWVTGNRVKTGTQYVVKLLEVPLSILEKYRGIGGDEKIFPMSSYRSMNRLLKTVILACGINKHITFHCARHTFATTVCLMNEVPLETLSKMLGHKNITTTQIYAKITAPMIETAMTRLEGKIGDKFAV